MEIREKIQFAPPEAFAPTDIQMDILGAVAERQGCPIHHVVHTLQPSRSESSVRAGVRVLLSKGYLDGGNSGSGIVLRLTSRGRLLLTPGEAR